LVIDTISVQLYNLLYPGEREHMCRRSPRRREQDLPTGITDERLQLRMGRLIKPGIMRPVREKKAQVMPVELVHPVGESRGNDLECLWEAAVQVDSSYQQLVQSVREGCRTFPPILGVKVSISECSIIACWGFTIPRQALGSGLRRTPYKANSDNPRLSS